MLRSALDLAGSFAEVAQAATAPVAAAQRSVVDHECEPILFRTFSGGYGRTRSLTSAQRALLRAFVDTD
ncbi:hypothetical protein ABT025_35940 [Streptomyces sp. NPDC002809]|uniref:hypothetical protein n=1 Tax=Streptomyces sp. NPDC002809 TaxID=3154433 RepID=UPI00332E88C3